MSPVFLYIEDDALSREIMQKLLKNLGYTNLTIFEDSTDFETRISALNALPDVFFLDIHMQPHNGFEMLAILRNDARFASRKIIAVTASVMNEEVAQLRHAGFDGAIGKPLDFEQFPDLLAQILRGKAVWSVT